ncbi:Hypothetical protein GbCGDNIH2_1398 [Granulibacter bethesdensis]|uniref:Uncharacterized protein n=2 Tax=Granulibacter bethesdensis TaxID=364410 RepID=Q0BSA6_GRABC|nr:hypothetical protein [Granulibacter bethesdensis]ABI62296.1 Hypothetical protein GbCGDNIH1_1398 [Granulibacter bethesdensis CGDNIH1]AHJ68792.1 Hypothetical protein GbCGDNIH2_1398 [Granulibacter bethesdensis]APH52123.1 Hypothetical protein GbCGDNIH5_1398 [Granulibacter bethesdensis]APH59741.1 Hypothetical protein GbCGDNIH7_1398 [Granulibacter bethesdensis]APH64814.1 Hypothetical protein GbCGDNIH1I4_1398 [Granulibacter bethesdensis]
MVSSQAGALSAFIEALFIEAMCFMTIKIDWRRVLRIAVPPLVILGAGFAYVKIQEHRNAPPPPLLLNKKGPDGKPLPVEPMGRWSGTTACTAVCKTQTFVLTLMRHTDGSPAWYRLEQIYKGDENDRAADHVTHSLGPWTLENGAYQLHADKLDDEFTFVPSADGETLKLQDPGDASLRTMVMKHTELPPAPGLKVNPPKPAQP